MAQLETTCEKVDAILLLTLPCHVPAAGAGRLFTGEGEERVTAAPHALHPALEPGRCASGSGPGGP